MPPLVTVIVPAYNCAEIVGESLDSILAQTVRDIQVVCVNDCSSDATGEILRGYSLRDERIAVLSLERNGGPAAARNMGIDSADGKYWAFIDSDDVWAAEKLERQISRIEKTGADICYTSYGYKGSDRGGVIPRSYTVPEIVTYRGLLRENVIGCSTVLIRAEALSGLRFDPAFFHEDYALWLKLLRMGKTAVGLRDVLVQNRTGGRSSDKWKAAANRWDIYRRGESLSVPVSAYYLTCYAVSALRKYNSGK